MSARKPPQCRKCLQPMRGHKADFCSVSPSPGPKMKEEEDQSSQSSALYLSPPPSPPPPSESTSIDFSSAGSTGKRHTTPTPVRAHRVYTPDIMSEPSFIIPETGYFHRRNPNFRHLHTPQLIDVPHAPGSLAPTEIVGSDDGQTATPSVRSASPTSSEQSQPSQASHPSQVLRGLGALFAMHETPLRGGHAERMCERAGSLGMHTAIVSPPRTFGGVRAKAGVPTGPNMDGITEFIDVAKTGTMNSRLMLFIYDAFAFAPLFVVCLMASVLGGYICKTYL